MSKINILIIGILLIGVGFYIGASGSETTKETAATLPASTMTASADGFALWQFPDKKALDPELFGTPQNPRNINLLPLVARAISEDGASYTTTVEPTMFSNNTKETTGSITISVTDLTKKDAVITKDKAEMEANFKGPNGEDFKVVLKQLNSTGGGHEMLGGVGTNVLMHGSTGIGSALVAEEFSYITLWGRGDFYKDGELVDTDRVIHMMVSERTRDENFKVGFGVAQPEKLEIHLAMPPKKFLADGPVDSPLPTGVILPNGKEQPFIHTNFYGDITLNGNQFVQ